MLSRGEAAAEALLRRRREAAAEARADALLRSQLDPYQLHQLDSLGGFAVRGSDGCRYVVVRSPAVGVYAPDEGAGFGYFAALEADLPRSDRALALKLAVESAADAMREVACVETLGRTLCLEPGCRACAAARVAWAVADA